jgi:hypothetical protein
MRRPRTCSRILINNSQKIISVFKKFYLTTIPRQNHS